MWKTFFAIILWCGKTQHQVKQVAGGIMIEVCFLKLVNCIGCINLMKFSMQRHSTTVLITYLFPSKLCDVLIVYFFIHLSLQFYSKINKIIYSERSFNCDFIIRRIFFLILSSHEIIL